MADELSIPDVSANVARERTHLRIPSRPEWISPTVEYLKQKAILSGACDESRAGRLELALHEALTNSVVHGNLELSSDLKDRGDSAFAEALAMRASDPAYGSCQVDIETNYDGQRYTWVLTDQGQGFDADKVLRRREEPEEEAFLRPSGRGILLMKAFLDDVRYEDRGRRVVLTFLRSSGEERRQCPRIPLEAPLRIAPLQADGSVDWDLAYEALAQNLSAQGIGILQAHLATASRVLIALDCQGQVLYLPAEIRHCQRLDGKGVEIGCRFLADTKEQNHHGATDVDKALAGLLESLAAEDVSQRERRADPRMVFTRKIGIFGGPPTEPAFGFGRDLSRSGMAFLTSAPLALEPRILSLAQNGEPALRVRAQVLRCDPILQGVYSIAVQFVGLEE
jgi:anti-sigma regulatory factor (Ser/Thr protein kinase)